MGMSSFVRAVREATGRCGGTRVERSWPSSNPWSRDGPATGPTAQPQLQIQVASILGCTICGFGYRQVLANLGLRERTELGLAFEETMTRRAATGSAFSHRAMHLDSRPEWVYVVGSSSGIVPADLDKIKWTLMVAALVLLC